MIVREMAPADRATVVGLMADLQDHERAMSADRPPGSEVADEHLRYLQQLCETSRGRVLVAESEGRVAGFLVVIEQCEDPGDRHLYPHRKCYGLVTDIAVAEDSRGRGIGQALMAAAEEHCRVLGLSRVQVIALADNEAAGAFYLGRDYQAYEVTYLKEL